MGTVYYLWENWLIVSFWIWELSVERVFLIDGFDGNIIENRRFWRKYLELNHADYNKNFKFFITILLKTNDYNCQMKYYSINFNYRI